MVTGVATCHRFDKLSVITNEINKQYPGAKVSRCVRACLQGGRVTLLGGSPY